jgi:hypothetical protein
MTPAIPGHESAFEQDVSTYLKVLPSLLSTDEGKFVLIGEGAMRNVFESRDQAMATGYEQFGSRGFLVQEIARHDLEMGTHWHP